MNTLLADFDRDFAPRLGLRASGFRKILELLQERAATKGPLTMVETGCVRAEGAWEGDGNSTVIFERFARETGSPLYAIDISPAHCDLARRLCPAATVRCGDSVATLYDLCTTTKEIDFLYLDSIDLDWANPHPSALHHLKELCAAARALTPGSIVFVDDNREGVGKGIYVREFMESIGAETAFSGYQIGYVMP